MPALLGANDKQASRVDRRRAEYVEERKKLTTFDSYRYWADVEADEATFRKGEVAGCLGSG